MFVEIVDSLRCPRVHEDSWLVLSADVTHDRDVLEGVLGCPVCHAEFPVHNGVAHFEDGAEVKLPVSIPPDTEQAMRLAAFLELTDARGFALLCGEWASHASAVGLVAPTPLLLVNPANGTSTGGGISALVAVGSVPLAPGSALAAAVDAASGISLASITTAVRPGGRILAPASMEVPPGVRELVRDESVWVGELERQPTRWPVKLERKGR